MDNTGRYYLQRLVALQGQHTYPQSQMAEEMRNRVAPFELPKMETSQGRLKRAAMMALASTLASPDSKSLSQMVSFLYDHSEIQQRHFELELSEISNRKDWHRMINQATYSMCDRALKDLFSSGMEASQCDGLIAVSSTYSGFPGIARKFQEKYGFPLEAICYDLTAMGCVGALHGIYLAQMLIDSGRCKNVCIVCADAMGTHGQAGKFTSAPTISQLVANCLSSDGAAALILGRDPGPAPIFSYTGCQMNTRLWPHSAHLNILSVSETNQPYMSVGKDIQTRLLDELGHLMDESMLDVPVYLHPGGIALMRLVRDKYPQLAASTAISVSELEETGNIGSPSVLLVLKKALDRNSPIMPCFRMIAFGPGKVTAILLIENVESIANA
jgi:predicted naringenin-chalcone synthase